MIRRTLLGCQVVVKPLQGYSGYPGQSPIAQVREAQATEELTATAAMLVELKARAAQGQAESAKHRQEIQALRQEYRTMVVSLDDKVRK